MKKLVFIGCLLIQTTVLALPLINAPSAQLGGGYSHDDDQALPITCLNLGPITAQGTNIGVVDLSRQYDLSSVEDQLDIKVKGHVGFGLFSAGMESQFMHYLSNDKLSESLIYRTNLQFKDSLYHIPAPPESVLNSTGAQWISNPIKFRQYCGDSYVAQMHHGAYLYVALQFQFLSAQDKTNFDAEFSGDYANLAALTLDISRKIDQSNISGNMHIVAIQEGGDPQYLSGIFDNIDPTQPSSVSECSLSKIEACNGVMNSVMKYITSRDTGFPSQLIVQPGEDIPHNAAEIGVEAEDYNAIVPIHTDSKLTPAIVDARDQLGNLFLQNQEQMQRARYLLNSLGTYPFIYEDFLDGLNAASGVLSRNYQLLLNAGQLCFNDLDNCLSTAQQTISGLTPIDPNLFLVPDTYTIFENNLQEGATQQLFVATQTGPAPPVIESFLGVEISPIITGEYDVDVQTVGANIYMTKRDHVTQNIIAQYRGVTTGYNQFSGTVTYPNSPGLSGAWSGTFTPTQQFIFGRKS